MAKASYVWSGSEWLAVASALPQTQQRGVVYSSATSYTLGVNDTGKALVFSSSSPVTVTVPRDSTYEFVTGQTFLVIQGGSGQVTVQAASGAVVNSLNNNNKTSGQYAELRLLKIEPDEWVLSGDLTS
jgi:hypothetical protein